MKKIIATILMALCFCCVQAQTYFYINKDIDPAGNKGSAAIAIVVKDSKSDLWLYWFQSTQCENLLHLKNLLSVNPNIFADVFNAQYKRETFPSGQIYTSYEYANGGYVKSPKIVGTLKPWFYKFRHKKTLAKCNVYEVNLGGGWDEFSISLDGKTMVIGSNLSNPVYFKRVSISDFKFRKSQDDLF